MASKRIHRKRKKRNRKVETSKPPTRDTVATTHVPLCAMGGVIDAKNLFAPIHQQVTIEQKVLDYRPTDKLIFATIGIIAGADSVYDINTVLRPNLPLLAAFGYDKCADQSVIQQTINAATEENVGQLSQAAEAIFTDNSQTMLHLNPNALEKETVTIDIDLSALPSAKAAQGSEKGYVPKKKNQYTRQLARVLVPETQEIVAQQLYSGSAQSLAVFKEMVGQMEGVLQLDTKAQRAQIRLRLDAGFGTAENINFALWRGYQILVKGYSWKRARALAPSVEQWVSVPSEADNTKREAGFVTTPHRYGRRTVQVAVRTPKKTGEYSYSILVSTDLTASVAQIVTDYDKRSGVPESTFCQDYQGLGLRKRRKGGFLAQQVLVLLSQLAHNLTIWMKSWLTDALADSLLAGEAWLQPEEKALIVSAEKTVSERGMKRFLGQILHVSGRVAFVGKRVVGIYLNPLYPLITRIKTALEAFLKPYNIRVLLDEN